MNNRLGSTALPCFRARLARRLRFLRALPGWAALVNKVVPSHSAPFVIQNGSTVFSGDISSFIDRQVYLFGGYESASIQMFLSCVPAGRKGTVLDIGANVGNHSLEFSRVFNTVHAFEPNPLLWAQFEENMQLNRLRSVRLHKVGLADRDEELALHMIAKPNFGLGTFSKIEQYDLPLVAVATCPVRHAANYLSVIGVQKVDAIKIDVQGFEPEVLCGLADVLKRDQPVVWCEIGAGTLTKMTTIDDLSKLIPFQFRCRKFQTKSYSSARLIECDGVLDSGDYLITPKCVAPSAW